MLLPIPIVIKKRTKIFIDVFVDRWFRGFAGLVLLLLISVGSGAKVLSMVVLGLVVVWLVLVLLIRKEYVNAFRQALQRREIELDQLTINITDASTINTLRESLRSPNEREIEYALDMLVAAEDRSLLDDLLPLLQHKSAGVRGKTLRVIEGLSGDDAVAEVRPLMNDPDAEVRLAAIDYVAVRGAGDSESLLNDCLCGEDKRLSASALRHIARFGNNAQKRLITDDVIAGLVETSGEEGVEVRQEVARALGELGEHRFRDFLSILMGDSSQRVVREAMIGMGRSRDREFIPSLLEKLSDSRARRDARDALAAYGNLVVGTMSDYMADERVDIGLRRYLPVVLSRIPTQDSVDALTRNLNTGDTAQKFRTVKALNKLRTGYPDLKIAQERIDSAFVEETRVYYEVLQINSLQRRDHNGQEADALLQKALEEKLDNNLERIFRLLGLHYPPQDIYNAYLGIVSSRKDQRASAVEFLDNLLAKSFKRYLFPIIDQVSEDISIQRGQELFGMTINTRNEALVHLMRGSDAWLRACAVYCAGGSDAPEVLETVDEALNDPDPVVVQTAEHVMKSRSS